MIPTTTLGAAAAAVVGPPVLHAEADPRVLRTDLHAEADLREAAHLREAVVEAGAAAKVAAEVAAPRLT